MVYRQEWKNQNVLMLGATYRYSDKLSLRAGVNLANNPVPDRYMSPLFPAIVKNHLNLGAEYCFTAGCGERISATVSHVPQVTATNRWGSIAGDNQTVSHRQTNWQVAYGMTF